MQVNCLLSGTLPKKPGLYLSSLRILFLLVFLGSFFVPTTGLKAQCQANQITVDGNPCEWSLIGSLPIQAYVRDAFGNGVVDSQFTEGSKDFMLAADLRWSVSQTKAKNDIANGAAVLIGDNLYFAGDRTSNNGDAQIGFWFYLGGTGPNTRPDGTRDFAPPHTVGDLLVLADFTGGGRNATVTVLTWVGTGGNVPNTGGTLDSTNVSGIVAINNDTQYPIPSTWSFINNIYDYNEFYEGVIDLGDLNLPSLCFSSFLLETRSSQSITASLDDFISGAFDASPAPPTVPAVSRCGSGSLTLTATCNGSVVRWYTVAEGGTPLVTNATYTVSGNTLTINNLTETATFYASCFREQINCESNRTSVIATVNPLPVCGITGNNVICAGGSTSFTATGGTSYAWTGPGGFTANTASTGTISAAGTYTVIVTSAAGCTSTCNRTLTVNPLPVCGITGNNEICASGSTSFTASGGASYSWTGPGGFTANTASTGSISTAGVYTVVVTSAAGCTSTCNRTLTVNPLPICGITGNNVICAGGSTSFTASGGASYSWTGPGGFTANTASTGSISTAGVYTVVVTSAAGCTSTCNRTLTVNPLPICDITGNNVICAGGSTSFTASGGASYSWTGPGGFTANTANTGSISAAGVYTVVVTSAAGCTSTCNRTLTVNPLPICGITGNNVICAGGSTSFTASGGASYAWTGPGGFTANTASTGSISTAGVYTVVVTSAAGCTSTCNRTLTVNPLPICGITGNNVICAGGSTSFTASGGASYSWTGPGGFTANTANTGSISAAGVYTVVVTSAAGCTSTCNRTLTVNPLPICEITGNNIICVGGSTSFTASGGASYSWTGPGGFTANTASTGSISTAGVYTVVVTSAAGCTSTCNRTLTVNALPVCEITGNNVICAGGSTSFTASGGTTFTWTGPGGFTANTASTGPISVAGTYTVTVSSGAGCTSTCNRTLTVNPLPICGITGNNVICAGGSTSFTASGGASYAWTGPGGFTANTANTGSISAAGVYTVVVTSAAGCTSTCNRTLTVNPLPICGITGNNVICAGGSTSFTASGGASYAWTGPGGFTANTASTGTISVAGTYTVVVTSAAGCTSTCNRTLTVNPLPICGITGTNTICAGSSTSFTASGGASYAWTGPAGFTANTANTGSISAAGVYTVVVTSAAGCTSTCNRTLTINNVTPGSIAGDQTLCFSDPVSPVPFTSVTGGTGSGVVTYQWVSSNTGCDGPWTAIAGATAETFGGFVLPLNQNTYYKRVATSTLSGVMCRDTSNCVAILSGPCEGPFPFDACTYTQGYYGNTNGNSCDGDTTYNSPLDLIRFLLGLTTDPVAPSDLTVGRPGRSVTVPATAAGAIKLNQIMPGGRAANILPLGNCTITDASCIGRYLTAQGKINNVLLSQTIVLSLNARMNEGVLNNLPIDYGWLATRAKDGCGEDAEPVDCTLGGGEVKSWLMNKNVVDYLTDFGAEDADVSDLIALANDVLGGVLIPGQVGANGNIVPSYSDVNNAVDVINNAFDGCRQGIGYFECAKNCDNLLLPCVSLVPLSITATKVGTVENQLKSSVYPNPYSDAVSLRIKSPVSGMAVIEFYDATGTRLFTKSQYVIANTEASVQLKGLISSSTLHYKVNVGSYRTTGTALRLR